MVNIKNKAIEGVYSLTFHCEFLSSARFPKYKGFSLRGAFGIFFKRVSCPVLNMECQLCLLRESCAYFNVFDPVNKNSAYGKDMPRPFILEPPYNNKTKYNKGDEIEFNVIIFGKAIKFWPFFILSFKKMGEKGIGLIGERGKFLLESIRTQDGLNLLDGENNFLYPESYVLPNMNTLYEEIEINIISPVRIKSKGHYVGVDDFSIDIFATAIYRKFLFLKNTYKILEEFDLEDVNLIAECQIVSKYLHWKDLERYSSRQKIRMKLGGLVGSFIMKLPSDIKKREKIIHVLKVLEIVHLGKNTTFGLGKIEVKGVDSGQEI